MKSPLLRQCILSMVLAGIIAVHLGCPSEQFIGDEIPKSYLLLARSNQEHTRLMLYSMPDGTLLNPDVYFTANGSHLQGSISFIAQFRSLLFIGQPEIQRIEVLDGTTYRHRASISTAPHSAVSICFANGTTAYTANADSTVGVIDLTVFRVARVLTVGHRPTSIAAMGNQVCVCNQEDETINILDTRTNTVTETVQMAPYPTFVTASNSPQAKNFCIVSIGKGKLITGQERTPAVVAFYDPFTRTKGNQFELSQLTRDASQTIPRALVSGNYPTAFIVLDDEVQIVDLAGLRVIGPVLTGSYVGTTYNYAREVILLWRSIGEETEILALDQQTGNVLWQSIVSGPVPIAAIAY